MSRTPQRFRRSGRRQRARAKAVMNSNAMRVLDSVNGLALFTLSAKDLGLSEDLARACCLYDETTIQKWREAIATTFRGVCYYALEVGHGDYKSPKRGAIHAHVIAACSDGIGVKRLPQKCKPIYDLSGVIRYLQKPPEPYSLEAELDYRSSRILRRGKAPKTRGFLTSRKRRAWNTALPLDHSIANTHQTNSRNKEDYVS